MLLYVRLMRSSRRDAGWHRIMSKCDSTESELGALQQEIRDPNATSESVSVYLRVLRRRFAANP